MKRVDNFVALTMEEYRRCHAALLQVLAGKMPAVSGQLTNNETGEVTFRADTPFNSALITACSLLRDEPGKPESFFARYQRVFSGIACQESRYARYYDAQQQTMHVALMMAIAGVKFSERTTPKALRAAFAAEFDQLRARHGDEVVNLDRHPAVEVVPGVLGGAYVPLGLTEFRRAYGVLLGVTAGRIEAPPPAIQMVDVDTGKPIDLPDTPFNRGWIAAAETLNEESASPKPTSFGARIMRVLPIAQGAEYAEHRTDELTMHIALIAAMASVEFNAGTPDDELRRAYAAEVRRQFGRLGELTREAMMEPDSHLQAMGRTRH